MKGFPWYAHHLEDYDRRTGHLSMLEHGAYRLLLDHYYRTGAALPEKIEHLQRICRANAKEERLAIQSVIKQYFVLESDGWHNSRADEEMLKAKDISDKRRDAARKSHKQNDSICSANGDTPTPTTHPEEVSKNLLSGFSVGKKNGSGKSDEYKLSKFAQTLANSFPDRKAGWVLIEAALDVNHLHHATAIKACKIQAKAIEKGWPHKWPQS